jgi:alpha-tubulin suppressor-like RCC1 family protein
LQLRDVQQVAVGRAHACARRKDGTLWCWGSDEYGVLGRGVPADGKSGTQPPAQVPGLPAVVDVALGEHHSCALGQKGRVRCWGMAEHGRLGNGVTKRHMGSGRPVLVKRLRDVVQLAAPSTGMHTCAVRKDRSVWCWGWNAYGEFGNLKKHRAHGVPVKAKGIHGVQQIATADTTTCGLFAGGQVKCWGGNQSGEVGDGTTEVRMRPVTVATLSEVVEIAAGSQHFCARTKAAKVWCWGFGAYGTLGDGSVNERKRPTSVTF